MGRGARRWVAFGGSAAIVAACADFTGEAETRPPGPDAGEARDGPAPFEPPQPLDAGPRAVTCETATYCETFDNLEAVGDLASRPGFAEMHDDNGAIEIQGERGSRVLTFTTDEEGVATLQVVHQFPGPARAVRLRYELEVLKAGDVQLGGIFLGAPNFFLGVAMKAGQAVVTLSAGPFGGEERAFGALAVGKHVIEITMTQNVPSGLVTAELDARGPIPISALVPNQLDPVGFQYGVLAATELEEEVSVAYDTVLFDLTP